MLKSIDYFKTYEICDLKDMLIKTTQKNSEKQAFRLKDKNGNIYCKTYLDYKKDVVALSSKLIDMGLKNEKIAVIGKNSYEWAVSYMACTIIGIVVPIDKESSNENIKDFLNISNAKAVIADTKYLDKIAELKKDLNNDQNTKILCIY